MLYNRSRVSWGKRLPGVIDLRQWYIINRSIRILLKISMLGDILVMTCYRYVNNFNSPKETLL